MKDKKDKKGVSAEEVQQALKIFQKTGGLIRKLPDQVATRSSMVGSKWGMFEQVIDQGVSAEKR